MNGIPLRGYTSLKGACKDVGFDYYKAVRLQSNGKRIVFGSSRITAVELQKVSGRGGNNRF